MKHKKLIKLLVKVLPFSLIEEAEFFLLKHYTMSKNLLAHADPELLEVISEKKALKMFHLAAEKVPAYRQFLSERQVNPKRIKNETDFNALIPETTKENYVKLNLFEALCLNGELPRKGLIEESSGSSGTPTNWIKSYSESFLLDKEVEFESNYLLGLDKKKTIILSCWSPGPWTTDLKFCELFEHQGLVKNAGPDIKNVVETVRSFGPKYHYLIGGYPPFCRLLLEKTKKEINWKEYHIDIITGGEGFVVGWREHLKEELGKKARIFSAYGASDLDIGLAFETPFTVLVRDETAKDKLLLKALGKKGRCPMIFQYNPLAHYIANTQTGETEEFHITPLDPSVAAPKIKYNLHDEGKKISFKEMVDLLKANKACVEYFLNNTKNILHLPFLLVYGRSDGTISINGTNVYPQQVEIALMKNKELFAKTHTFQISSKNKGRIQLTIKIELKEGFKKTKGLAEKYQKKLKENLVKVSEEYQQALKEFPGEFTPKIEICCWESGPFKKKRIKNKYIENGA